MESKKVSLPRGFDNVQSPESPAGEGTLGLSLALGAGRLQQGLQV